CCVKRPTRSDRTRPEARGSITNRSIHEALERDMADVLAFAEQRDGQIGGSAREAMSTAARIAGQLGGRAHALTLGGPGLAANAGSLGRYGAEVVHVGEHDALADYNPDAYAGVLADRIREGGYAAVVFSATTLA